MLECAKTGDRSGAAWQKVLQPFTNLEFVVSDAAKGIAGGVQAAQRARGQAGVPVQQGLDVFHTAQEAQRVLTGPWRQAEAAWDEAVAASTRVAAAKAEGRDARGAAAQEREAWARAERLLAEVEKEEAAWQRIRTALLVFRAEGTLNERSWAEAEIGAALPALSRPAWKKVRNFLTDRRCLAFVDRLHQRLVEAVPDAALRQACVQRWWLRHQQPARASQAAMALDTVQELLDERIRNGPLDAIEQAAYERVAAVLRTTVRASSAVEGINSVLRMQQGRHRKMTQGLLDLKRLYWNCRRLQTGKRRGNCPYQLLGAKLPSTNFWTLLQMPQATMDELTQDLSAQRLSE